VLPRPPSCIEEKRRRKRDGRKSQDRKEEGEQERVGESRGKRRKGKGGGEGMPHIFGSNLRPCYNTTH